MTAVETSVRPIGMRSKPIYHDLGTERDQPWIDFILDKAFDENREGSSQGFMPGAKSLPFDMRRAKKLVLMNPHHSACMRAKTASLVGMGFVVDGDNDPDMEPAKKRKLRSKASKILDPLCIATFQDVLNDVAEEYWHVGNGYMEVVRNEAGQISGIYHAPAPNVQLVVEENGVDFHYQEASGEGDGFTKRFARFGDLEDFKVRYAQELTGQTRIGELIHFRQSSSLNRWYGFPDWLAAVSAMELASCLHQHTHDFFLNRGVPEFMLFLLGKKLDDDNWNKIELALQAHIGLANSHKSLALNLTDPDMKVQVEKLALEGKTDSKDFSMMSDALALEVVTSHGTPPLLAGVQIPGKLGASNELPNALRAFQLLLIGPAQQAFTSILDCTLGDPDQNSGLGLAEGDFVLRAITDELDLDQMGTSASMRQTEEEAKSEGRDLSEGLKKQLQDIGPEQLAEMMGKAFASAMDRVTTKLFAD